MALAAGFEYWGSLLLFAAKCLQLETLAAGFEYWGSLLLSTIVDKLPETLAAGFEYWGSLLLAPRWLIGHLGTCSGVRYDGVIDTQIDLNCHNVVTIATGFGLAGLLRRRNNLTTL